MSTERDLSDPSMTDNTNTHELAGAFNDPPPGSAEGDAQRGGEGWPSLRAQLVERWPVLVGGSLDQVAAKSPDVAELIEMLSRELALPLTEVESALEEMLHDGRTAPSSSSEPVARIDSGAQHEETGLSSIGACNAHTAPTLPSQSPVGDTTGSGVPPDAL